MLFSRAVHPTEPQFQFGEQLHTNRASWSVKFEGTLHTASPFWPVRTHLRTLKESLKKSIYLAYLDVSQIFWPTERFIPPTRLPQFCRKLVFCRTDSRKGWQRKPVKWLQRGTGILWAAHCVFICPLSYACSLPWKHFQGHLMEAKKSLLSHF